MSENPEKPQLLESSFNKPYYDMPPPPAENKQPVHYKRKCSRCKKPGHYRKSCPLERALDPPPTRSATPTCDIAPMAKYYSGLETRGVDIRAEMKGHIIELKRLKTEQDLIKKYKKEAKDNFPALKFMYPDE